MTEYHHTINRGGGGSWFVLTQKSMGGNEYGIINQVTCLFSHFEALNDAFEVLFF